jgi:hypothetical protein
MQRRPAPDDQERNAIHDLKDTAMTSRSVRTKLLVTAVAVGGFASVAALGTFGTFSSSTSAAAAYSSGTVNIALGATGAVTNRLTVPAANLVPGDTIQRAADLSNTSTAALPVTLTTIAAAPSTLLDSSAAMGLQMVIDRCPAAWTEAGVSPAYTYTCSGTITSVLASRPVIGANLALSNLTAGGPGIVDHLRVTLTFPVGADNTLQGLSSTVTFAFNANQRPGTNQ